jgi:hypothetical protein
MLESHNCTGLEDCKQQDKERNKEKLESERTFAIKGIWGTEYFTQSPIRLDSAFDDDEMSVLLLCFLLGFILRRCPGLRLGFCFPFSFYPTCFFFLPADDLSSSEGVGLLWLLITGRRYFRYLIQIWCSCG